MSRRNRRRKLQEAESRREKAAKASWHADLHPETKKSVLAVLSFVVAALFVLSYLGKGGSAGGYLFGIFDWLLGRGYFFAPLASVLVGFSLLFSEKRKILGAAIFGGVLFLVSSLALLDTIFGTRTGGMIGFFTATPLLKLFDFWATFVIALGSFASSILLMLNVPIWRRKETDEEEEDTKEPFAGETETPARAVLSQIGSAIASALEKKEEISNTKVTQTSEDVRPEIATSAAARDELSLPLRKHIKKFEYKRPPLELLQGDRGTPSSGDIRANANIIKRTLENFGIDVEMAEVSIGPTVTQYTLRPAEGVKLARITALHNDLSLALAAHPIRIEAPIPGKSLVGIEVPNRSIALVGLRALLENKVFQESASPLLFALGRDVAGMPVFADMARMPHLLISGATGTGKSVSAHAIITSFLYRNPPEVLRFIIVDPKRVELSVYNDIPHLLTPVITDAKTTIQALQWATKEMDRRYDILSARQVRDIASYNAAVVKSQEGEIMPYLIIIIDELADLMAVFPREVESAIIRLAQMARAVGIHLIVSTQRPSVEVITGLIKANITSRIAFQVASQIDSRTILDTAGAEKLLGNGDMLFLAGDTAKPRRIQGAFVSEQEVKRVVDFLREEVEAPEYEEAILETKIGAGEGDPAEFFGSEDPLYDEAKELVTQAGKASASYLQRRLRVGYARAARLLDLMEARGVIGPGDGAKPREILARTAQVTDEDLL